MAADIFLRLRGHLSSCPGVSPNNCNGPTQTCASNITGANSQVDPTLEGSQDSACTAAAEPSPIPGPICPPHLLAIPPVPFNPPCPPHPILLHPTLPPVCFKILINLCVLKYLLLGRFRVFSFNNNEILCFKIFWKFFSPYKTFFSVWILFKNYPFLPSAQHFPESVYKAYNSKISDLTT